MAPPIPTQEPTQFVAGDTVQWTRVVSSYSNADGWNLNYMLVGPGALAAQPTVTVVNGLFTVTLPATATATSTAGTYRLIGWVDGVNAERHTVFDGFVDVLPNVATTTFANLKTHAEKMLAAIQAALEGRATADIQSYQIDGTLITKLPFDQLMKYRGIYESMVWREQNPGVSMPKTVVRFARENRGRTNAAEALAWPGHES